MNGDELAARERQASKLMRLFTQGDSPISQSKPKSSRDRDGSLFSSRKGTAAVFVRTWMETKSEMLRLAMSCLPCARVIPMQLVPVSVLPVVLRHGGQPWE